MRDRAQFVRTASRAVRSIRVKETNRPVTARFTQGESSTDSSMSNRARSSGSGSDAISRSMRATVGARSRGGDATSDRRSCQSVSGSIVSQTAASTAR